MARRKNLTPPELRMRLLKLKLVVASMKDAMPTTREELRRSACEDIDDLIGEVA
jgi:hypothetical protein